MPQPFVPDELTVPVEFAGPGFRLEPLGPRHNQSDHEAWMSSIDWIRATPGFDPDGDWPVEMSADSNLEDLEMHARHFDDREGFTYSILDDDNVIGCLYIYPTTEPGHDVSVRSWVRASRKEMDAVVYRSLSRWIEDVWPFDNPLYAPRPTSP